jgi:hypothetical protein
VSCGNGRGGVGPDCARRPDGRVRRERFPTGSKLGARRPRAAMLVRRIDTVPPPSRGLGIFGGWRGAGRRMRYGSWRNASPARTGMSWSTSSCTGWGSAPRRGPSGPGLPQPAGPRTVLPHSGSPDGPGQHPRAGRGTAVLAAAAGQRAGAGDAAERSGACAHSHPDAATALKAATTGDPSPAVRQEGVVACARRRDLPPGHPTKEPVTPVFKLGRRSPASCR